MLAASIHEHAGLGNQIWRYVCCRVFAEEHGYDWGVSHPGWRGPFLNMDWGKEVSLNVEEDSDFKSGHGFDHYHREESIHHPVAPGEIGDVDKKFYSLSDNTYINGTFQKMRYIEKHRDKICSWLTYDNKITDYSSENVCVIQLRGGDYTTGHSMLPPQYYHMAMKHMIDHNPNMKFVIVTDDPNTASKFIPGVPIVGSAISDEKDPDQKNIGWYTYPGGPVGIHSWWPCWD